MYLTFVKCNEKLKNCKLYIYRMIFISHKQNSKKYNRTGGAQRGWWGGKVGFTEKNTERLHIFKIWGELVLHQFFSKTQIYFHWIYMKYCFHVSLVSDL